MSRRPLGPLRESALVLLLVAGLFYTWTASTSGYQAVPRKRLPGYYDLLARAFVAKQLSLLVQPLPELLALPDPYDPQQNAGLRLHDAALFKGKYYLYYGPTPALLLFAPFRLLTRLDFPQPLAISMSCWLGLLFSFLLLRFLARTYLPQTPEWLVTASLPALAFGNVTPFLLRRPQHYEVAIAAGFALVFASLYYFASGALGDSVSRRRLAIGSLLLGLAAGARVPQLAAAVVPLALVVYFLFQMRRASVRDRVATTLALLGPLAACLFLLGLYNYLRFESWTDFGLRHTLQGLVSARVYRFTDPARIPTSFFYYVLVPPRFVRVFPFVLVQPDWYLPPPPGYVLERVAGILPMAPLLGILVVVPAVAWRLRRRTPGLLAVIGLSLSIGSALLGLYCLSAGTMRYEVDFATYFLVPALLLWFAGLNALKARRGLRLAGSAVFSLLLAATVVTGAAISISGYYDNLFAASPGAYRALQAFFRPVEKVLQYMP